MKEKKLKPVQQIQQLKKQKFIETYAQLMGHISDSCRTVGIDRGTYYNWLDSDLEFAKAIMEQEMDLNDDVRQVLIQKAADGDMTAVIFYLKSRHPDFKPRPASALQFESEDGKVTVQVINYAQDNDTA